MPLDFVNPTDRDPNLNIFLYGPPGSSKTTGALSAPGPILYLNAEGTNAAMFARRLHADAEIREVVVESGGTLNEALLYLRADGQNGIKTVVLDSLGAIFTAVLEGYTGGGKPTLPQYGDTTTAIERFARALRDLPVNVVLIAHEQAVKDEVSGQFERLPFTGTTNPSLGIKLMSQADVVGYAGRIEADEEHPQARYVAQLFDAGGRRGKDRTDLLGEFPELNISDWLETYGQVLQATTNGTEPKEAVAA